MGLINVIITGRLISRCVSSLLSTKERMEPDSLSLNLALVTIHVLNMCACVHVCVSVRYLCTYVPDDL